MSGDFSGRIALGVGFRQSVSILQILDLPEPYIFTMVGTKKCLKVQLYPPVYFISSSGLAQLCVVCYV